MYTCSETLNWFVNAGKPTVFDLITLGFRWPKVDEKLTNAVALRYRQNDFSWLNFRLAYPRLYTASLQKQSDYRPILIAPTNRLRILTMTNQTFCRVQSKPDECNFSYSLEMNNSVGKRILIHTLSLRFLKFKYNI